MFEVLRISSDRAARQPLAVPPAANHSVSPIRPRRGSILPLQRPGAAGLQAATCGWLRWTGHGRFTTYAAICCFTSLVTPNIDRGGAR